MTVNREDLIHESMEDVRCRCCKRLLGVGPSDFRVYCDEMCYEDYPVATAESRDALIEAIFQKTGRSKTSLAKQFEVSRQRVDQILGTRSFRRTIAGGENEETLP
jgi:hypothetical protein